MLTLCTCIKFLSPTVNVWSLTCRLSLSIFNFNLLSIANDSRLAILSAISRLCLVCILSAPMTVSGVILFQRSLNKCISSTFIVTRLAWIASKLLIIKMIDQRVYHISKTLVNNCSITICNAMSVSRWMWYIGLLGSEAEFGPGCIAVSITSLTTLANAVRGKKAASANVDDW